jgi:hypothetical protein
MKFFEKIAKIKNGSLKESFCLFSSEATAEIISKLILAGID